MKQLTILLFVLLLAATSRADVTLPKLFSDHLVLQRDQTVPIWGEAKPGEKVIVKFRTQEKTAIADNKGKWLVKLDPLTAGGPDKLTVTAGNTVAIEDVLVGEVWVASGQSNMEFTMGGVQEAPAEMAAADYPQIRMFTVPRQPAPLPQEHCEGSWDVCTPKSVGGFSAVGYFYARALQQVLHVPVGIINTSYGGTIAEAWTSLAGLKALPGFREMAERQEAGVKAYLADAPHYAQKQKEERDRFAAEQQAWQRQMDAADPGLTQHWFDPAFDTAQWRPITLPVIVSNNPLGTFLGSRWFRKEVEIPARWVGQELELRLGAVDDVDETFVNGTKVGSTWYEVPNYWLIRRVYTVPAKSVTTTKLSVTVRVFNQLGQMGLFGPASEMRVAAKGADEPVLSLAGDWHYTDGAMVTTNNPIPKLKLSDNPGSSPNQPTTLFNGMIAPLIPYAIRGVIWYQGESNAGRPFEYRELFPGMIASWRQAWGAGEFPFAFVQLANYGGRQEAPIQTGSWADLREAQTMTLRVPHTTMAVIIDIGDAGNIHPRNKQDVGKRLALGTLAQVYGQTNPVYSGPLYRAMKVEGDKIRLAFDFAQGLAAKGGTPVGFAIAGADKAFHIAQAHIDGETVVVHSPLVLNPVAVRYGWANNPIVNLTNRAGLPASPCRTDDWAPEGVHAASELVTEQWGADGK